MRTVFSSSAIPEGFDTGHILSLRWKRRVKRVAITGIFFIPLAWIAFLGADYLARTPRERKLARIGYWDQIIYGARFNAIYAWNWLTAEQDDPKGSALPVMELYIRTERLKALKAHLPESGRIYQPGLFKVRRKGEPNSVLGANLRFRGDSMNHWAFPQKSWRVKLKRGSRYLGMRQFNLYLPRTKSQIPDFLGYRLAENMGGLEVPKAFPIHLRVNRQFDGVRVFLEQVNEDFFLNHNLSADRLFVGDIDFKDVYAYHDREFLFESVKGWEVVPTKKGGDTSVAPMQALLEVLPLAATEPERFKTAIEKVLDVQMTLRYMAYLEIVGSIHADETHNQRYFFDLRTQKLKPIVWDPVAYYREKIDGIDFAPNGLFQALLQIPEYREEKNRCVWEAIHGALSPGRVAQLITDSANSVRKEILASPQKVYTFQANLHMMPNSEWESSVHELVEKSRARSEVLRSALRKISISAQSKGFHDGVEDVQIMVGADAGFEARELVFDSTGSVPTSVVVEEDGVAKRILCVPVERGGCVARFDRFLSSKRRVDKNDDLIRESRPYRWSIRNGSSSLRLRFIRGVNTITKEPHGVEVKRG